jgi:hypothetical protein
METVAKAAKRSHYRKPKDRQVVNLAGMSAYLVWRGLLYVVDY